MPIPHHSMVYLNYHFMSGLRQQQNEQLM